MLYGFWLNMVKCTFKGRNFKYLNFNSDKIKVFYLKFTFFHIKLLLRWHFSVAKSIRYLFYCTYRSKYIKS